MAGGTVKFVLKLGDKIITSTKDLSLEDFRDLLEAGNISFCPVMIDRNTEEMQMLDSDEEMKDLAKALDDYLKSILLEHEGTLLIAFKRPKWGEIAWSKIGILSMNLFPIFSKIQDIFYSRDKSLDPYSHDVDVINAEEVFASIFSGNV